MITAAIDGFHTRVWVVDSRTGKELWAEGLPNARAVQYSPDGRWLMVLVTGQPLQRRDAATALITMCAGGAMSTATIIERL